MAGELADNVELSFESIRHHDICAAADKDLSDNGSSFADGFGEFDIFVNRNISPSEKDLTFGFNGSFDFLFTGSAGSMFSRKENHTHAVIAGLRKQNILLGHFGAEELVRNLNQDACAVAKQRVGADRTAVIQILKNHQCLLDNFVAWYSFNTSHKTESAGIMFKFRLIQSKFLSPLTDLLNVCHGDAPNCSRVFYQRNRM